jgi:hypothetical protein
MVWVAFVAPAAYSNEVGREVTRIFEKVAVNVDDHECQRTAPPAVACSIGRIVFDYLNRQALRGCFVLTWLYG